MQMHRKCNTENLMAAWIASFGYGRANGGVEVQVPC